jgi:hypothetical protein
MTTTASPIPDDDHRKRLENVKATMSPPAVAPIAPIAATPDPTLLLEKTIDLVTEVHAVLDANRQILTEVRAELVSIRTNLPTAMAGAVSRAVSPMILSSNAQCQDIDACKQQSGQALDLLDDFGGSLKALFWIWLVVGGAVVALAGSILWRTI